MIFKKYNYLLFVLITSMVFFIILFGWHTFWLNIGINTISPNFYDFRKVQQLSQSVNIENYNYDQIYTDTIIYPFNYPFLWIYIGKYFKLQNEYNFNFFIIFFIILYITSFFANIKKYNYFIYILLFLSNSSLLLIERGNVDMIIYVFLFLSLYLNNDFLRFILYTFLSILKIFPTVLLFAFKKIKLKILLFYLLISFLILFILRNDITYILINTPVPSLGSYGIKSFHKLSIERLSMNLSSIFIYLVFIITSLIYYIIFYKNIIFDNLQQSEILSFKVGASIYVFTFILMGNFDYRLIFLIFCIPLIYNIRNTFYRNLNILLIIFSMNIYYMKIFFGKFGVIINLFSKIFLFYFLSLILFKILYEELIISNNKYLKLFKFK